ncbi:MAG: hypothetical protein E6Z06_06995 [Clostridiales bacterium]|uniref:Uncharacterized protein n=1 Tax=Peptococcus niger TaxID=2741 RepID=A0A1G6XA18_PEPNI|nr:hypothetical protein [Peptococcus niger]MDU1029053.1 hypothetical protein [Clostridiales bacterium]MDU7505866.1 hypothetical protein [Clostridia bacterium]MDU5952607.1 hypothetical protein [Clostridiales bacterium]MDU7244843.1 hypothetical protein [Clostridiales bacterium]SDD74948.1 hypothetical protein SAMN04489866_10693 [Peptococcus niger]
MTIAISFLLSIMANVTCHYICKWLDEKHSDN